MTGGWLAALGSFALHNVIALALVPVVLLRKKEPAATTAWIFAILLMPFVGAIAFLLFGNNRMARRTDARRARKRGFGKTLPLIARDVSSPIDAKGQVELYRLLDAINPLPASVGNRVEIFHDMRENYARQLAAIDAARHHVHLEYYIFQPDQIGKRFREALIAAARRGVQVRFVYDAVGSIKLTRAFLGEMVAAGIAVAPFLPLNLLSRRWIFNFRNHRKILVVDGELGFLGGANIGEEYLGQSGAGEWADTHLALTGPIVAHLQRVFLEDWSFAHGEEPRGAAYFPKLAAAGQVVAQVVPGGPDLDIPIYKELYFSAVTNAAQRLRIMTPYFVPTEATLLALQAAARRGVDVKILVPNRSTHYFVKLASQSYYEDLLAAGVQIFEFDRGFLHSKIVTVDGRWSVVGTANFDNRSMVLNFEIGVALYDVGLTQQLDRRFDENLAHSRAVEPVAWLRRPLADRVVQASARLFSPIL